MCSKFKIGNHLTVWEWLIMPIGRLPPKCYSFFGHLYSSWVNWTHVLDVLIFHKCILVFINSFKTKNQFFEWSDYFYKFRNSQLLFHKIYFLLLTIILMILLKYIIVSKPILCVSFLKIIFYLCLYVCVPAWVDVYYEHASAHRGQRALTPTELEL